MTEDHFRLQPEFDAMPDEDCYAILVTDVQLMPATSGNRMRILGFIRALRELGWKVGLVAPPDVAPIERLKYMVDDFLPVQARRFRGGQLSGFNAVPFRRAVSAMARKLQPRVVVAQYAWLGPALSDLPSGIERWIDCHDLLHERTQRFSSSGLHPWVMCNWEEERACLACGDVLITTQERETSLLQSLMPDKRVKCILTPVDLPPRYSPSSAHGNIVLTVGAHHSGNLAVADFARDAWPRVLERVPSAQLHVVGGIGAALEPMAGVSIFGKVQDLRPHYSAAAVVVCPVQTGTGVKTKMLEALRFGKVVVATAIAVEGMPAPEQPAWIVTDSLSACADAIPDLLTDSAARAKIETAAFAFGEAHISAEAFRTQIGSLLPSIGRRSRQTSLLPDEHRTVSVIVPHSGNLRQLRSCLQSLHNQSYPRRLFEVVVVTDALSPVEYALIASEFPGTLVIRRPGTGLVVAKNRGALHSRSAFLAFVDSDCRVYREWLAKTISLAEARKDHCVVACKVKPLLGGPGANGVALYETLVLHERSHAVGENRCATSCVVMRRSVWELVGPFHEKYSEGPCADNDWSDRAASSGVHIVTPREPLVVRTVDRTWAALRRKARLLACSERLQAIHRGDGANIDLQLRITRINRSQRDLRVALRHPDIPWFARPGVAAAAFLTRHWSSIENHDGLAVANPPLEIPERVFGDPSKAKNLSLRSISVIIPSFGWPVTLPACLHALQRQLIDVPLEIIVVVNGPDAATGNFAFPGVRIVRETKLGPAAARNAGVRVASGDVLAFTDSDCVPSPNWLAGALDLMRNGAAQDIIAGAIYRSGKRRSWTALYDSAAYLRQEEYVHASVGVVTANVVVHRSVFGGVGPFDEKFPEAAYEDTEWAARAGRLGVFVSYAPAAIVDHPCMFRLADLQRKTRRMARGELLMQHKLGRPPVVPSLLASVRKELNKVVRNGSLTVADRLCLTCVAAAAGYSGWQAARQYRQKNI